MTEAAKPSPDASASGSAPLRPVLGLFDCTMIVMGTIIGAGIFNTPQMVAAEMHSPGALVLAWVVGGAIALTGAFVFAELGAMMPRAGGQYVFLRETFGGFTAFMFGWVLLAAITSSAMAYVGFVFADHLETVLQGLRPGLALAPATKKTVVIVLITALTLLNIRGLRLGSTVQNLAMVAKILGLLLVVALGALVALGLFGDYAPEPPTHPTESLGWAGAGAALLAIVFSYGGFQNVAATAAEVKNPQRNIPVSILLGTVCVIGLYVALNLSLISILGVEQVAATETPVARAAGVLLPGGETLVASLVLLSTAAILQALLMVTPRVYYAMGRDGVFFRAAGWVHPTWRTPAVAIGLQGALVLVHVFLGDKLQLIQVTTLFDWFFFGLCSLALFLLRKRRPDATRPYRAFGYPWIPLFYSLCCITVVVSAAVNSEVEVLERALAIVAVGIVLYLYWRRASSTTNPPPQEKPC